MGLQTGGEGGGGEGKSSFTPSKGEGSFSHAEGGWAKMLFGRRLLHYTDL